MPPTTIKGVKKYLPKRITKPMTAWEFYTYLIKVMKAEPARVKQDLWMAQGKNVACAIKNDEHAAAPACGTVGCTAGWGTFLLGYDKFPGEYKAADLMGLGMLLQDSYSNALFEPNGYNDVIPIGVPSGTRQYMRYVVKGIREFMKEHREQLKRTLVFPKGQQPR